MKEKIIAKRYAEAFLGFAKDTIGIEKAVDEIKKLFIIMFETPDFLKFLSNMEILYNEKCAVIDRTLKDFSLETRQFLKYLTAKGRIKEFNEIAYYLRMNYAHGEAVNALLKSTHPLEPDLLNEIETRFEKSLNKKINFYLEVDPHLQGGISIRVENTVYDGSLKKRLIDLREKLLTVQVN